MKFEMIKLFLKISFYSFVVFCVINLSQLIYSIIHNKLEGSFPKLSFGFPFEIYYQFEVKSFENCYELQHGSFPKKLIYNYFLFWILVFLYFIFKNNKQQTKNNKQQTT
jgi:hypothetical protein